MKRILKEDLVRIKGQFSEKYGTVADDWMAFNYNEYQEMKAELLGVIEDAAQKIKGQVEQVRFDSKWQAFYYSLGKFGIISFAILCAIMYGMYWHSSRSEYQNVRQTINEYPNLDKYRNIYKNGNTITKGNTEYLVVYPFGKENADFGTVYEFDSKNKRVLVPIRTK